MLHSCVYHAIVHDRICIVDGGWSEWRLGPCSKTCGGGVQNYTRVCDNPKPSCGGEKCEGPSVHTLQKCNDNICPGKIIPITYHSLLVATYIVHTGKSSYT